MLKRPRLPRRWKLWSFLGAFVLALGVADASGFCSDVGTAASAGLLPSGSFGHGAAVDYFGAMSLEERIVIADVIARVKLSSVAETAEEQHHLDEFGVLEEKSYAVAMEFTFDVLEYLKGNGGAQVKAIVDQDSVYYETALGAKLLGDDLLSDRDKRWDDREAILFLRKTDEEPSTKQAGRYWLGYVDSYGERYTIANRYYQVWLPDAATPAPTPVAGGSAPSASAQRFLLEEPSDDPPVATPTTVASAAGASAQGTSGQSGTEQKDTIALSELKTLIAELEAEVTAAIAAGPTEYTAEEYRTCVFRKYEYESEVRYTIDLRGEFFQFTTDIALTSGLPKGSHVYWGKSAAQDWPETQPRTYGSDWIGGRDAALFSAEYPSRVFAARPLPSGEYRIYYDEIPHYLSICDGMPEEEKKREELVVKVSAPIGALHEAFFDPVAISTAVGADATNGALKPASFAIDDTTTTTLDSIAWESRRATIKVSPAALPANHHVDFIGLDGKFALRLDIDHATKSVDGDDITLMWGVCKQPWKADDQLMLRIRDTGKSLRGATNDVACDGTPIPVLTPVPTPIPSPTPAPVSDAPKATPLASGGMRLDWDATPGATQYKIAYRLPASSSAWTEVGGSTITTNSQDLAIYNCGITFEFRVRPKLANGNWGDWSAASSPYTKPCS